MNSRALALIQDVIQEDVGKRGLRSDPARNLITETADDFVRACHSLAETPNASVAILTGFFIPLGQPPAGETDGPLGALYLARALVLLGIRVVLATDSFCIPALRAGLEACGLEKDVVLITLPSFVQSRQIGPKVYCDAFFRRAGSLTHLLALERVGPNHTPASLKAQMTEMASPPRELLDDFREEVTPEQEDRCYSMRGRDLTESMSPAHWLLEAAAQAETPITTVGIGDGGNELGMGKISWDVIRRNIPRGSLVACRVPVEHLIVAGISNWGAYGLAAGVRILRGAPADPALFDTDRELELLELMVQKGPLVDGVSGLQTASVDGLEFPAYAEVLRKLGRIDANRDFDLSFSVRSIPPAQSDESKTPDLSLASAAEVRRLARTGEWRRPTSGLALGHVQANLVVVPSELAFDFLLFCQRNPKPCPLLDVTEPGSAEPRLVAPGADLRTDVPGYRVYRDGVLADEPTDLVALWQNDWVGFLLGCSFTFENAMLEAGLPVRHIEAGCNVPMYRTNIACEPAGVFHGPMVVSMRPMTMAQAIRAIQVTGRYPRAHGAPVHIGDPAAIGISDINHPDFGDAVEIRPGEIPVFWACGVTPQAVAMEVCPPILVTHKPGYMFVTDLADVDLEGG